MSVSPDGKPQSSESRAHMMAALSGMQLPAAKSNIVDIDTNTAVVSIAAVGRTATVEDMFNLAAPEVDSIIAKLIPMNVAPTAAGGAPAPASLPTPPIEICEIKAEDGSDTAKPKSENVCEEAVQRGLLLATRIGRSKELPISSRVDHPRMSSYHCEVYYHPLTLQLFVRDVSTNGTFLNGSTTRMEKGKLVELVGSEMLQFVNPAAPTNSAVPLPSTTFLLQRIKNVKVADDDALEDELTCGITKTLLYKPVMALPCLHTFSAHAVAMWIDAGNKTCPECRGVMSEVRPSHKVSNLLEQFLKTKAGTITYYTKEEMAEFDKQNTIPPTGKVIAGGHKRRPNYDDPDYNWEEDEEDPEEDEEDEDDGYSYSVTYNNNAGYGRGGFGFGTRGGRGGMPWVPAGLPFTFGQFQHANNTWGPSMQVPTCPECNVPAPYDGFQCPATVSHINCHMCKTPFPDRPLCGIPQRCALCALPFCDMYFKTMAQPPAAVPVVSNNNDINGTRAPPTTTTAASASPASATTVIGATFHPACCKNPNGKDYFRPISQHTMQQLPASLFGGNVVEQSILSMYLATGGCPSTHFQQAPPMLNFNLGINNTGSANNTIPVSIVWAECLNKFQSGLWVPDVTSVAGPLTPNTAVCQPCCGRIFASLLYHYRRAIKKDDLPPAITARPNCWYGIHCRTQFHNTAHAQAYNHACPQEKRKE